MEAFLDYLAGAITLGYLIAGAFFLRFWGKTRDRLFLAFGVAFAMLAVNQGLSTWIEAGDERTSYVYALRVLAFVLILAAIVDKNISSKRGRAR